MPNPKGHAKTLKSFPKVTDEPLGRVIGVRLPQSWYAELEGIGNLQEFMRQAVREKLDRMKGRNDRV